MMANADFILSLVTESMCVMRGLYLLRLLESCEMSGSVCTGRRILYA